MFKCDFLKDLYYYLGDEDALVKIEKTWAENHEKEDREKIKFSYDLGTADLT